VLFLMDETPELLLTDETPVPRGSY